ncbi:YqaJ viral recombinase family protein [Leucobacter sp. HY1908]
MTVQAEAYVPPVLAELEGRAGAPDTDREAWLAERRGGVTATEVRDLYMRRIGRPAYKLEQELIDEKLGRSADSFTGNRYTEWGKEREPVIEAVMAASEGYRAEARVFKHADNARHLASPDGVGVDFDELLELLEIKTAGYDLPPGSPAYDKKGYEFQAQWQMHVLGARRVRLVVEERLIDEHGDFYPGPLHRHWIERDDALIAELVAVADAFLAEVDRQREEGGPVIDEAVDTHAVNYLRALDEEKRWAALKKSSYAALLEAGVSQESGLARVTFSPGRPGTETVEEVVDLELAAVELPDETKQLERAQKRVAKLQAAWDELAAQYTKTVSKVVKGTGARVTVTAGKETK